MARGVAGPISSLGGGDSKGCDLSKVYAYVASKEEATKLPTKNDWKKLARLFWVGFSIFFPYGPFLAHLIVSGVGIKHCP